ncbi:MAG: hypothetical protein KIT24_12785 [Phycisphaeraceae bacterium]|nr:hypothetical protein [Phycisphaeraceae bacterium]
MPESSTSPERASASSKPPSGTSRRAWQLFLVGVIGMSFVGFVVGMRQGASGPELASFDRTVSTHHHAAIPATPYAEFDRRTHGPNRGWQSSLSDLAQPDTDLFAPVHADPAARVVLLEARASRRAFEGAPPTIPHPADQMTAASCMACHGEGLTINNVRAPRMSHPYMQSCTQCHVEQSASDHRQEAEFQNLFVGLFSSGPGQRAWEGAPPTIPHATFMREDCMACHGPKGPEPIRTSHPWQTNCLQCHAPSAVLDQGVHDGAPSFLPAIPIFLRPSTGGGG